MHLYLHAVQCVPLFAELSKGSYMASGGHIIMRLCMEMRHEVAMKDDVVMLEGRIGDQMFIIEQARQPTVHASNVDWSPTRWH